MPALKSGGAAEGAAEVEGHGIEGAGSCARAGREMLVESAVDHVNPAASRIRDVKSSLCSSDVLTARCRLVAFTLLLVRRRAARCNGESGVEGILDGHVRVKGLWYQHRVTRFG